MYINNVHHQSVNMDFAKANFFVVHKNSLYIINVRLIIMNRSPADSLSMTVTRFENEKDTLAAALKALEVETGLRMGLEQGGVGIEGGYRCSTHIASYPRTLCCKSEEVGVSREYGLPHLPDPPAADVEWSLHAGGRLRQLKDGRAAQGGGHTVFRYHG